ncbi:aprataxin and PNK-like factor isoform X2 [Ochlerotatus camptorhynchus]|uniref:aprataxin and PNK-like factor isoform X2 n=1 Tax=Ochlerotatus camptorhynchus TaxID=644619 RepID=UPI0031D550C6
MAIHFYLYDCEKKVDIAIASAETVIGRDSILQCDDKRISRQHGIIKHDGEQAGGTIQITSTHSNPIFLRTDDQVLNILTKDLTATLRHGEKFALLPDQYWFEVRFKDPEVEETAVSSSSPSTEETTANGNSNGELLRVRTMEEVNSAVAEQRVLPDWMSGGGSGEKRKNDEESEAESAKKAKGADDADGARGGDDVPVVVKTDPDVVEASTSRPKSPSAEADKKEIKKETADSTSSPPGRPSCEFGIRCYRRTLDHRAQFAHPNDSDYRRPSFPAAPSDAPHCPYGVTCYRRNPQHFRDFQHPDSTTTAPAVTNQQVPAAGHQPIINADRRRRRRLARDIVIAAMVNPDLFDSDDDDDGEDLFDAESDSDEYRPDGDIDDGDDDDDDDDGDDEEEEINFRVLNDDENEE